MHTLKDTSGGRVVSYITRPWLFPNLPQHEVDASREALARHAGAIGDSVQLASSDPITTEEDVAILEGRAYSVSVDPQRPRERRWKIILIGETPSIEHEICSGSGLSFREAAINAMANLSSTE